MLGLSRDKPGADLAAASEGARVYRQSAPGAERLPKPTDVRSVTERLLRRARYVTWGYASILTAFFVILFLGIYLFNRSLAEHQHHLALASTVHAMQSTTRHIASRNQYFKELLRSDTVDERLLRRVKRDISDDLDALQAHLAKLIDLEVEGRKRRQLGGTDVASYLYSSDAGLQAIAERLIARSREVLTLTPTAARDGFSLWMAVDAAFAPTGRVMQRFDDLFVSLHRDLDDIVADWSRVRGYLYATGLLAILLELSLVFRPLITSLRNSINETLVAKEHLLYLADHDVATGFKKPAALYSALAERSQREDAQGLHNVLFFCRIDNLGEIRARFGVEGIKALWARLQERIELNFEARDLKAKMADCDFAIVIDANTELHKIEPAAQTILAVLNEPVAFGVAELDQRVSLCLQRFCPAEPNLQSLFANADLALKESLSDTVGRPVIYDPEIRKSFEATTSLKRDIKRGIEAQEFEPWYQPKVDLGSNRLVGFEALIRWRHPERGLLVPAAFLDVAEQSLAQMWPLTRQVIEASARQHEQWSDVGLVPPPIAVNLPQRIFLSEEALEDTIACIERANQGAQRISVEVTEKISIDQRRDLIARSLQRLRQGEVKIALDDFGTGFASLSSLLEIDYDEIKIDRSFVKVCTKDPKSLSIVENTLTLSKHLHKLVTAEGIETEAQLQLLRRLGCDVGQGYYFAKPLPADEATSYLQVQGRRNLHLLDGAQDPSSIS